MGGMEGEELERRRHGHQGHGRASFVSPTPVVVVDDKDLLLKLVKNFLF